MPNYAALHDELINDPIGRGYGLMSDPEAADSLNTPNRNVSVDSVPSEFVVAALVASEVASLTAAQQRTMWGIIGAGTVRADDAEVKAVFADLFGAATTTRANLLALGTQTISRAQEIGIGFVKAPDVNEARAMDR